MVCRLKWFMDLELCPIPSWKVQVIWEAVAVWKGQDAWEGCTVSAFPFVTTQVVLSLLAKVTPPPSPPPNPSLAWAQSKWWWAGWRWHRFKPRSCFRKGENLAKEWSTPGLAHTGDTLAMGTLPGAPPNFLLARLWSWEGKLYRPARRRSI